MTSDWQSAFHMFTSVMFVNCYLYLMDSRSNVLFSILENGPADHLEMRLIKVGFQLFRLFYGIRLLETFIYLFMSFNGYQQNRGSSNMILVGQQLAAEDSSDQEDDPTPPPPPPPPPSDDDEEGTTSNDGGSDWQPEEDSYDSETSADEK